MKVSFLWKLITNTLHFHIALNKLGWDSQFPETWYHILVHAAFIPSTNTVYNYALEFHIPCLHWNSLLIQTPPLFCAQKNVSAKQSVLLTYICFYLENGKLQSNVYFFGILTCNQFTWQSAQILDIFFYLCYQTVMTYFPPVKILLF